MIKRIIILFFTFLCSAWSQNNISYDASDQYGMSLNNNQIIWDKDQKIGNLLIDRSSTYFEYKFSSFDFNYLPMDSTYVKSKFTYEFGDYGFDKLNIGLRKHSEKNSYQFIAMKKSFFGTFSEFADDESSPLSLSYKVDYNTIVSNHNLYFTTGYFRENSNFIFDNKSGLDTSSNFELSDFLSLTIGDVFTKKNWEYNLEMNHISKNSKKVIIEYPINNNVDLERNRFNISANNNKFISIEAFINNSFYEDRISLRSYNRNTLFFANNNKFSFGKLKYGIDYIDDEVAPNIFYNTSFGAFELILERKNLPARFLFDGLVSMSDNFEHNNQKIESWDSLILNYSFEPNTSLKNFSINKKFAFSSSLKYAQAKNIIIQYNPFILGTDSSEILFKSDDMLSLKTKFSIPLKDNKIDISYYHNFYDSLISSNRSNIIKMDYHFNTSFFSEKLGIDGKLSLKYFGSNDSQFSFDYFKNMPTINNSLNYNDSYNLGLDLNISIAEVLLTVRLKNALDRLPLDGDYSISNAELFNPMNSLLSFGIIWEFDD